MNTNNHRERLSQRLKRLRNYNEFTQQQVADALNIDRSTYAYYETGKTEPNMETTIKLAKLFKVSISELLTGESDEPSAALEDSGNPIYTQDLFNNLTSEEKFLVMNYRLLSKEDQKASLGAMIEKNSKDKNES